MFGHSDQESNLPAPVNNDNNGRTVAPTPAGQPTAPSYMDELAQEPGGSTGNASAAATSDDNAAPASAVPADLLEIKQQALQQLSPLLGHLDQSPEEKFRTTMMMIQAADNQSLIKDAYEAAKQINDEKARAQALLDIVNEINYFTQNQG
jgi:hypothetical protein